MNLEPGPDSGGPDSTSQELGASTLRTGIEAVSICEMMVGKGSRRGPPKEKPKMASTRKSEVRIAGGRSVMKGTERLWSWVLRRWLVGFFVFFFFPCFLLFYFSRRECIPGREDSCPPWDSRWMGCNHIGPDGELLRGRHLLFVILAMDLLSFIAPFSPSCSCWLESSGWVLQHTVIARPTNHKNILSRARGMNSIDYQ